MSAQIAAVFLDSTVAHFELPAPDEELMPGVFWGAVDAFPTPAYWFYQVLARRVAGEGRSYRLGTTLTEEVAACMLGGHGISASIGVAAFHALRDRGLLASLPQAEELEVALSAPLKIGSRSMHYRFARQKSRYLAGALKYLRNAPPPISSGRALRDALLSISGIGFKTASWVARNWLSADDVAILDIHILRAGALGGFFSAGLTVERHYLQLEEQFIAFSRALRVRSSELDAVIWLEMANSARTVKRLLRSTSTPPCPQPDGTHARESRLLD